MLQKIDSHLLIEKDALPLESVPQDKVDLISAKILALGTQMELSEIEETVRYIEAKLPTIDGEWCYLHKEETRIARTVEFDPASKMVFIHLKTHNVHKIGEGVHKVVTFSVLYDSENPQLVASAIVEVSEKTEIEIEALKKFKGTAGIIEPLYIHKHKKRSGEEVYEIITPYYNENSLKSLLRKNDYDLPLDVKVKLALDILTGASALNRAGYIMCDNHLGNVFVSEENGQYQAVLGDLGGYVDTCERMLRKKPFGPSGRAAPADALCAYAMGTLDVRGLLSSHTFAVGRLLYEMFYGRDVPWRDDYDEKYPLCKSVYSNREDPELLVQIEALHQEVLATTRERLESLQNLEIMDFDERFELIVLSMLSPYAEERKTNAHWKDQLAKLYRQLKFAKAS